MPAREEEREREERRRHRLEDDDDDLGISGSEDDKGHAEGHSRLRLGGANDRLDLHSFGSGVPRHFGLSSGLLDSRRPGLNASGFSGVDKPFPLPVFPMRPPSFFLPVSGLGWSAAHAWDAHQRWLLDSALTLPTFSNTFMSTPGTSMDNLMFMPFARKQLEKTSSEPNSVLQRCRELSAQKHWPLSLEPTLSPHRPLRFSPYSLPFNINAPSSSPP